jgi:amino acid adenylation domain-containing protein
MVMTIRSSNPRPAGGPTAVAPFLSPAQERLWFLDQINPGDVSLNVAHAVTVKGVLDRDLLRRCLRYLVSRHESLRTTFATTQLYAGVDSRPVQLVADTANVDIELISSDANNLRHLLRERAHYSFDLSLGPLIRATLIKVAEQSHVLLFVAHRIIADDESLKILLRELFRTYAAGSSATILTQLPFQYRDYTTRQLNLMESNAARTAIEYWRETLAGAPAAIELPSYRFKPGLHTAAGATVTTQFNKALVSSLRVLSESEQVTLRTTLLGAFAVLLSRYGGHNDLVVGAEISNRHNEEVRNLIGPVSNLLPLRIELSPHETFSSLMARVQATVLDGEARAFIPFEKLLDELNVERNLNRPPLVQITFKFCAEDQLALNAGPIAIEEFEFDTGFNNFELTLEVVERAEELECRFSFDAEIYSHVMIERMAAHFEVLLEAIVANPEKRIGALPLLTAREREQVLVHWNQTAVAYPAKQSIQQLFEEQVDRTPKAIAVTDEHHSLTYEELERCANQLAWRLRREGVGPEVLVAVCLERTTELLVALLGILKVGGAYVPLDPSYPQPRLQFMLEDSAAAVVLTERALAGRLPDHDGKQICLDQEGAQLSQENDERLPSLSLPQSLAYVIYTSGSTGRPKGVGIAHHSTVTLLQWAQTVYSRADLAGVLASTSICFDLSVYELFLPLSVGGTVVIAADALQLASGQWQTELTLINTVPSAVAELLRLQGIPANVRVVNLAGEPLPQTLVQQLYEQKTIERVYDLYGPSEDTTYSTFALRSATQPATIGKPIANTQVYLLDSELQPVPIGVPGELYLGGAGLARGYLKRPELTAEKFIPNPFGPPATRLYRTGDVARYQEDGNLQYVGRSDQQVKVRGYRIELGEIETTLRTHSTVRDAAVTAREGKIVAYVVRSPQGETDSAQLACVWREFLSSRLPAYMVPAFFVPLDRLPLTPSGKLDRRALPAPEESHALRSKDLTAPRDTLEEQLVKLWTKILQAKAISVTDNFFELGGDSLLAARLFAHIHNRFGKNLPLATLFSSPTIEQLANVLRESEAGEAWSSLVSIQPHGSKPPLFCVHAAGANVLIYRPMSRHLGDDQPVYALQAQGLDGQQSPLRCVEEMATKYVKEIRAFQPDGPYCLLGASFGGLVAFEMAQQLLAQGQKVAFLGMLNTNCPAYSLTKRLGCHWGHLRERGLSTYSAGFVSGVKRRLKMETSGWKISESEVQSLVPEQADDALVQTVAAILEAEQTYVPRNASYPGKITLFWAEDAPRDFEDNRLAWRKFAAGGCEIHVVPGTHTKMREEPHVQKLVEKLRPCLEKAHALVV